MDMRYGRSGKVSLNQKCEKYDNRSIFLLTNLFHINILVKIKGTIQWLDCILLGCACAGVYTMEHLTICRTIVSTINARLAVVFLLLFASLLLFPGCRLRPKPALCPDQMRALPMPTPVAIAPGDVLEFKFFYNPELNETQTVDPDGKLSLQLIGKVDAAGRTMEDLGADLKQRYAFVLRNPEVTVIPRSLPSNRVYIGGQVIAPGPVDIQGEMTLLQAIMFAGGFRTETAALSSVIVVRQSEGRQVGTSVDLRCVLKGKEDDNFRVYPRDVIYVPQTHIAKVDQWVDQYLYKIVPTQFGLTYSFSNVRAKNTNTYENQAQ